MSSKIVNGLTPKNAKLATIVARQILTTGKTNATQAGLQVFDTKNPESARVMATQALQNPTVQQRIDEILNKMGLTLDINMGNIGQLANFMPEKVSADTVLHANLALLKLRGADLGSKHTNLNVNLKGNVSSLNFKDVKEELKIIDGQLGGIMDEPTPIDEPISGGDEPLAS